VATGACLRALTGTVAPHGGWSPLSVCLLCVCVCQSVCVCVFVRVCVVCVRARARVYGKGLVCIALIVCASMGWWLLRSFPFGPVAVITPFNFPLEIPTLQTMGALFMGNRPLVKVGELVGGPAVPVSAAVAVAVGAAAVRLHHHRHPPAHPGGPRKGLPPPVMLALAVGLAMVCRWTPRCRWSWSKCCGC
jgi:hypothetical protein